MPSNKTAGDVIPFLMTLGFIFMISYTLISSYIIPYKALLTGIIHAILVSLVLWSLIAVKITDPGYVKTYLQSMPENDNDDIELNKGNPIDGYQKKYIL
jgi:hypothetical protein